MTDPRPIPRRGFFGRIAATLAAGTWLGRAGRAEAASQGLAEPYVGEMRMFAGDFAPVGWLTCEGQMLPISPQYEPLFFLIGTTYGGDGEFTFALPDLRGRSPMHMGNGYIIGQNGGNEMHFLSEGQIPAHTHVVAASAAPGSSPDPAGRVPARNAAGSPQYAAAGDVNLAAAALLPAGGTQPHDNMQPFLGVTFIIAYEGVYPSPS